MLNSSKKRKGHKLEKFVEGEFAAIGWKANVQPGSGVYHGFPHDVRVVDPEGTEWIIECKARKSPVKTLLTWAGKAHMLIIKPDFGEPWVMMRLADFQRLPFHDQNKTVA